MINPKTGDVLVYKSDADRLAFIEVHRCNKEIDESYNDGLVVSSVNNCSRYEINNLYHIYESELKYFKIKEEKMLKPDDIISVEMSALTGCMLKQLVGTTRNSSLAENLYKSLDFEGLPIDHDDRLDWGSDGILYKAALAQFKDPNQDRVDALEKVINDASAELARIKNVK